MRPKKAPCESEQGRLRHGQGCGASGTGLRKPRQAPGERGFLATVTAGVSDSKRAGDTYLFIFYIELINDI